MKKTRALGALAATTILAAGLTSPAPAQAGPAPAGCKVHHQVGATKYVKFGGMTIGSVKQYYGYCSGKARNWSYVWVWDQARKKYNFYSVSAIYRYDQRKYVGQREGRNIQELRSTPVGTARVCTSAGGTVYLFSKTTGKLLGRPGAVTAKYC